MKGNLSKFKLPSLIPLSKSLLFILVFICLLVAGAVLQNFVPPFQSKFIYGIIGIIVGLFTVWLFNKKEQHPFSSIGLNWERKTPLRFILGLSIGTIIFMVMIAALLIFSPITITYNASSFGLNALSLYVTLIPLVLMEEIGFRTYPQLKLNSAYGIWVSQIVIALCFGAYHILNGWSVSLAFTGPFVWAFVFGLAALWSGGIAMPAGIHLALNVLQNLVGLKGGEASLWKLDFPAGTPKSIMQQTDHVGLILHGIVLISALATTAWYKQHIKPAQAKL
jgi:membrane protease YdiL (CAAX protease family)